MLADFGAGGGGGEGGRGGGWQALPEQKIDCVREYLPHSLAPEFLVKVPVGHFSQL
jgi:hypothetical protein